MRLGSQNPECSGALDEILKALKLLFLVITPVQSPPVYFFTFVDEWKLLFLIWKAYIAFPQYWDRSCAWNMVFQCHNYTMFSEENQNKLQNTAWPRNLSQMAWKSHGSIWTFYHKKHKHMLGSLASLSWSGNSREYELCFQKNFSNLSFFFYWGNV